MSNFYTGKGDKGRSYVGKKSVSKTRPEVEALGQMDELNSMLGVLKSQKIKKSLKNSLHQIQENLFIIQSHIANIMLGKTFKVPVFNEFKVEEIEEVIRKIESSLKPVKKFVISGSNPTSAWLDLLRAKSRNAERAVLRIENINELDQNMRTYLNRLSSLFFALARYEARKQKEQNPSYK